MHDMRQHSEDAGDSQADVTEAWAAERIRGPRPYMVT